MLAGVVGGVVVPVEMVGGGVVEVPVGVVAGVVEVPVDVVPDAVVIPVDVVGAGAGFDEARCCFVLVCARRFDPGAFDRVGCELAGCTTLVKDDAD